MNTHPMPVFLLSVSTKGHDILFHVTLHMHSEAHARNCPGTLGPGAERVIADLCAHVGGWAVVLYSAVRSFVIDNYY